MIIETSINKITNSVRWKGNIFIFSIIYEFFKSIPSVIVFHLFKNSFENTHLKFYIGFKNILIFSIFLYNITKSFNKLFTDKTHRIWTNIRLNKLTKVKLLCSICKKTNKILFRRNYVKMTSTSCFECSSDQFNFWVKRSQETSKKCALKQK